MKIQDIDLLIERDGEMGLHITRPNRERAYYDNPNSGAYRGRSARFLSIVLAYAARIEKAQEVK